MGQDETSDRHSCCIAANSRSCSLGPGGYGVTSLYALCGVVPMVKRIKTQKSRVHMVDRRRSPTSE